MGLYDRDYMKKDDGDNRRVSDWENGEPQNKPPQMSRMAQVILAIIVALVLLIALGVIRIPF